MEEYMKLVSDSKNERITQLLKETDNYLAELGDKVRLQKQAVAASGSGSGGAGSSLDAGSAAPMVQEESAADKYSERSQYYKLAHTVGERIETQPAMLQGGQLKEYQMAGLRWPWSF